LSQAACRPQPDAVGFVLAGGRSSRMGADKSLVPFCGRPLLVRALETLRQAGLPATIAGARSALSDFAPLVEDLEPHRGPLAGICAALASCTERWAVFVPIDLPLLPASLLEYLLHHARVTGGAVTIASVNGFAQTFPLVVDRVVLPALELELAHGRGGCFSAFQAATAGLLQAMSVIPAEVLAQTGQAADPRGLPPIRWFLNVNAPEDLRRAEAHCTALIA